MISDATLQGYINQQTTALRPPSEETLCDIFQRGLGVTINPQAMRMFIIHYWTELDKPAHRIHEGKR